MAVLFDRLRSEIRLKLVLMGALNLSVYGPYLFLQRHHYFPSTVMPESAVDRMIPFSTGMVWVYLSIYILMPIGPFLLKERDRIFRYAGGIVLIGLCADVVFVFWPTTCLRPEIQQTNPAYHALTAWDNVYHAFPSLHAAFAVYSALWGTSVMRELGSRSMPVILWSWTGLILYATLATKQHVAADIIAGAALGSVIYACINKGRVPMFDPAVRSRVSQSQPIKPG